MVSAMSNLYGLYPTGTGPLLPDNVDNKRFMPPNLNLEKYIPNIGLNATPYMH